MTEGFMRTFLHEEGLLNTEACFNEYNMIKNDFELALSEIIYGEDTHDMFGGLYRLYVIATDLPYSVDHCWDTSADMKPMNDMIYRFTHV